MLDKIQDSSQNRAASQSSWGMLSLALFIMLLAFFIILNANVSYDDVKFKQIQNSLDVTFNRGFVNFEDMVKNRSTRMTATFEGIDELFQANLNIDQENIVIASDQISVFLPIDSAQNRSKIVMVSRQLGIFLRPRPEFATTLYIVQPDKPGYGDINQDLYDIQTLFANIVLANGLPAQRLHLGIRQGEQNGLLLIVKAKDIRP